MGVRINPVSPQQILQLARTLSPAEMRWLRDALDQAVQQTTDAPDPKLILQETFGLWADRTDQPADAVEHVNQLRRSSRWEDLEPLPDETD